MVYLSLRSRYRLVLVALVALLCANIYLWLAFRRATDSQHLQWAGSKIDWGRRIPAGAGLSPDHLRPEVPLDALQSEFFTWESPDTIFPEKKYKPAPEPVTPISDPFPLLSSNPPPKRSQLQAPLVNRPPQKHHSEQTPLFIGFTRNWPQLLQCLVSYIAAGWPPEDIYVVENTGVMFANREGQLTLQNPFYLNHTQLHMLGVNVIVTPTLMTFAQLQNFYLWTALTHEIPYFFWTHQDLLVFSNEQTSDPSNPPSSLYNNAVQTLRYLLSPAAPKWAHHFFAYDHLTLVNRDAVLSVGGWDTQIPFYATDCDMYVRLMWAGYWQGESEIGLILDVASVLEDVGALLRVPGVRARVAGIRASDEDEEVVKTEVEKHGETWERLVSLGYQMEGYKYQDGNAWRNTWQIKQRGGQGEPFYRDAEGFERGVKMMIDTGRAVFAEKWGHRGCDIAKKGIRPEDAWRLEKDWNEDDGEGPWW